MPANATLALTTLDFDTLKQSFINYMRSQDQFKDYDYASSNMNVLIDLLTYNSHLNAWYTHMEMAESFLDSAQLKSSVISHAKELNYIPRSARSAEANVVLTFTGSQPTYVLQKGQTFSATIKSNTYTFSLGDNILLTSTNGYFTANLNIFEGVYLFDTYTLNSADPTQRLVISNANVDVSSVSVVVYENNNIQGTAFSRATTLLGLDERSKVFFVQQAENEQYEVLFGDGIVGYRPADGSTVSINYRVTHGSEGNGAKVFIMNFNPGPTHDAAQINVQTISVSAGGADSEDVESIRFYAPRAFQIQERATSANDYAIMLRSQFPEIAAISTYGGEELNPPQFGRVAIAVKITDVDGLPDSKVQQYKSFLSDRTSLTTKPIFVDPEFSFLAVRSTVNYNINLSTLTPDNIKALVVLAVQTYAAQNLGEFGVRFRYSRFCSMIDETDNSIVGNETEILLYRKIIPVRSVPQKFIIDYHMPLQQGVVMPNNVAAIGFHSVFSSSFFVNGQQTRLEDDGSGNIYLVASVKGVDTFTSKIGTVDYEQGVVRIDSLTVTDFDGPAVKIYVRTREKDILENQATIMDIEGGEIQVQVNTVRE